MSSINILILSFFIVSVFINIIFLINNKKIETQKDNYYLILSEVLAKAFKMYQFMENEGYDTKDLMEKFDKQIEKEEKYEINKYFNRRI